MDGISCICRSLIQLADYILKLYVNELSRKLGLKRITVIRNLDKLKKVDLITYKKCHVNKIKVISLTANGTNKLNDAEVVWKKFNGNF